MCGMLYFTILTFIISLTTYSYFFLNAYVVNNLATASAFFIQLKCMFFVLFFILSVY